MQLHPSDTQGIGGRNMEVKGISVAERHHLELVGRSETHCSLLHQLRQHDDDRGVVLHHHPPEVDHRVAQGTLGHDERSASMVALGRGWRGKKHNTPVLITVDGTESYDYNYPIPFTVQTIYSIFPCSMYMYTGAGQAI